MAFGLYSLMEAALLVLNAICVLHEERFLSKVSLHSVSVCEFKNKGKSAVTSQERCSPLSDYPPLRPPELLIFSLDPAIFQYGWSANSNQGFGEAPGVKKQVLDIIRSVRTVMRIPLIFVNSLVILKKLVMG